VFSFSFLWHSLSKKYSPRSICIERWIGPEWVWTLCRR
jgi:hypothetical protein